MNAKFTTTAKGTWAYIQKSVRIDGRSTTQTISAFRVTVRDSERAWCANPRQWVIDLAARND